MDLARCLSAQGKLLEAEQYLRKLTIQLPHSRRVHKALFSLQLRSGLTLDAAWTMRRACRYITLEEDLIGLYLYCVVENGGPSFLIDEVQQLVQSLKKAGRGSLLIRAAMLRRMLELHGYAPNHLKKLEAMAEEDEATIEVMLLAADALLRAAKVASARRILRLALRRDPSHPRVLSLFAETYLRSGPFYNPEFALQLSKDGCAQSSWRSPREMHVLAEAFFHLNDTLSALGVAKRARREGRRLFGAYRDSVELERLIDTLREDLHSVANPDSPEESTPAED